MAHLRQVSTTSHRRHTALASSIWRMAGPVFPMGKNSSGSSSRQAARSRQSMKIVLLVSAGDFASVRHWVWGCEPAAHGASLRTCLWCCRAAGGPGPVVIGPLSTQPQAGAVTILMVRAHLCQRVAGRFCSSLTEEGRNGKGYAQVTAV